MAHTIRCYDYVNHPYADVKKALTADPIAVFRAATQSANKRAATVAVGLRVDIAGVEVKKDVAVEVQSVKEESGGPMSSPQTRIALSWQASSSPRLFPFMRAVLSVYPLTATETQLELQGDYEPPFGLIGGALDTLVGHRIAEASVHRFLNDVAQHLRQSMKTR